MYKFKAALVILVVAAIFMQQTESKAILTKIKLIKAPLAAAKFAVVKGVATKLKIAAVKKWEASKAKGAAVGSIIAAPFKIAKAATVFKVGAIKKIAAIKVAAAKGLFHVKHKKIASAVATKPKFIFPVASIPAPYIQNLVPTISQYSNSFINQYTNETNSDSRSIQGPYQIAISYLPIEDNNVSQRSSQLGTIKVAEPHTTYGVPNF